MENASTNGDHTLIINRYDRGKDGNKIEKLYVTLGPEGREMVCTRNQLHYICPALKDIMTSQPEAHVRSLVLHYNPKKLEKLKIYLKDKEKSGNSIKKTVKEIAETTPSAGESFNPDDLENFFNNMDDSNTVPGLEGKTK